MASQARRHHHEWRAKAESYKDDNIAITNVDAMVKADTPSGGRQCPSLATPMYVDKRLGIQVDSTIAHFEKELFTRRVRRASSHIHHYKISSPRAQLDMDIYVPPFSEVTLAYYVPVP
ncbi:uncharacterized protein TRUGW13939_11025 [Talaromyces rugulosus]|uniref:Uncharacterized protein n=1 Tax=Talaromyces rugulosus TaxID=121627 RepID=A0A7H8RBP2_TALRU|nr:uncharacterized protein TRUGW13939_11025 [Talaromyces rugulosus]QKX63854.1 hypothetical protein TRUGW13939_11025 [Talaromyces rugulosus]